MLTEFANRVASVQDPKGIQFLVDNIAIPWPKRRCVWIYMTEGAIARLVFQFMTQG